MSKELKFEFNDCIVEIEVPSDKDNGYVSIWRKKYGGKYAVFTSPNKKTIGLFIELQKHITDLETKLAEKEKEIDNLYNRLNSKQNFYEMSLEKDYKEYLSRLNKLEKQCDKDKIEFAIKQLEKVKEKYPRGTISWSTDKSENGFEYVSDYIDNQINELKELKEKN